MDKLPAGIRAKFLKKQAALKVTGGPAALTAAESSTSSPSGSSTPFQSGAESQIPSPPKSDSSPAIPFPISDLEDCLSCNLPCTDEQQVSYPSYIVKSIDRELPLAGSVKPYGRHVLISTGRTDWIHSIDEEEGSVAQGIFKGLYEPRFAGLVKNTVTREGGDRVVLSNTSFAPRRMGSGRTEVMIMPEWKVITNVSHDSAGEFVKHRIDGMAVSPSTEKNGGNTTAKISSLPMTEEIMPFHSVVLICSHGKRDKRCGVTSKYLVKAFESGLRRRNIYRSFDDTRTESQGGLPGGGTVVGCLSHIGGHKFAGNVIIYRRRTKSVEELYSKLKELTLSTVENLDDQDRVREEKEREVQAEGIWLGRVEPK